MDALADAVRAEPDDDLPRLIYADWLEERGDPRGTFIRAQVELHRLRDGDPQRRDWAVAESELLGEHENEWLGELADELFASWFHRGFIEVRLDVRRFVQGPLNWLDRPTVGNVHLYGPRQMSLELLNDLLRMPETARVRSLMLGYEFLQDAGAEIIARAPHLEQVVILDLATNGLTDAGAVAIAGSTSLPRLAHLKLANNHIGDAGASALAERPTMRTLDLTNNDLTSDGALALAKGSGLSGLWELILAGNNFDGRSRGARALKERWDYRAKWR
ncbi:MAG: TIGR02996 domain-containing protein [Gemmataceae bacterium]|nr:TIGR02996 domain-containing protein [Gemmataceae bacterium]